MKRRQIKARRIGRKAADLLINIGRGVEVAKNRWRLQVLEAELSSLVVEVKEFRSAWATVDQEGQIIESKMDRSIIHRGEFYTLGGGG